MGGIIAGATAMSVYAFLQYSDHRIGGPIPLSMSVLSFSLNAIAFACLLAMVVLRPSKALAGLLRWRPLVYTGEIAYGLYLLHVPASWIVRQLMMLAFGIQVQAHSAISVPITYLASFLAASISWRFFESSMLALKDRFTSPTL
jgi:peptidoglycan/LPS O-acetylase OafA/YrhL